MYTKKSRGDVDGGSECETVLKRRQVDKTPASLPIAGCGVLNTVVGGCRHLVDGVDVEQGRRCEDDDTYSGIVRRSRGGGYNISH